MTYVIRGLDPERFAPLYGMSDAELAQQGAIRCRADGKPGFPCRITLEDAEVGEQLILLNFEHLPVSSSYRSSYAIFVREGATQAAEYRDRVAEQLACRLLAVRGFSAEGLLLRCDVIDGTELATQIAPWLADRAIAYLHAYNARAGCFAARIDRS